MRDSKCDDVPCLRRWYLSGQARISQQLWAIDASLFSKEPTPQQLYERLNLITFNNMEGPLVKASDQWYLAKHYPKKSLTITDDGFELSHQGKHWKVRIEGKNTLHIENTIKNGTYRSNKKVEIYYDPVAEDFRVGMPSHCNLYSEGSTSDYRFTDVKPERNTIGEFYIPTQLEIVSADVFDRPNGTLVGSMHITSKPDEQIGEAEPYIRVCDTQFNTLLEPLFVYRRKFDPSLLIFERKASWINLSPYHSIQAWIDVNALPDALRYTLRTRAEVILDSDEVELKGAHRIRSRPNLKSTVLRVIDPGENGTEFGIEVHSVKGDWMQVIVHKPNPTWAMATDYKGKTYSNSGWLKWRSDSGKEYVKPVFSYGM